MDSEELKNLNKARLAVGFESSRFEPGTVINGTYEILECIGTGGMSAVFRARHIHLQQDIAIKVLDQCRLADDVKVKRFEREAKASIELNHPRICDVREFGFVDETPFLIMELVKGQRLSDAIKDSPLEPANALSIIADAAEALAYAHHKAVVHRDVTPANIMLVDENGTMRAKVLDFGIAKIIDEGAEMPKLTQTADIFGTPHYMSPEQLLGHKIDGRSDVYSLGCVLYETLVGTPPFPAENAISLAMHHVNESVSEESLKRFPASIKEIVLKCLEKKPEHRYQSMDELLADIRLVQGGKSVKPPSRKKSTTILAVTVAIVLFFTAVFLFIVPGFKAHNSAVSWQTTQQAAEELIDQGKFTDAVPRLQEALKIAEQSEDSTRSVSTLQRLVQVETELKHDDLANKYKRKLAQQNRAGGLQSLFVRISIALLLFGFALILLTVCFFAPLRALRKKS